VIRPRRPWAALATIVASAAVPIYLLLIVRQSAGGEIDDLGQVVVVTVLLVSLASLAALGAIPPRARRRGSLVAAALGLFVLGYLALWSIGALLLIAGFLAVIALMLDRDEPPGTPS
jgi:predicted metal-binding membrane protein